MRSARYLLSFLALLTTSGIAAASGYPEVSVDVVAKRISPRVYYVQGYPGVASDFEGFISNAAFVITSAGVVVFDSLGSPSLAWELRKQISKYTELPVVKVVVSHYHADHIYGLQVFKDEGAEIVAPAGALDYLSSPNAAERLEERRFSLDPWVNGATRLVKPDLIVDRPMAIRVGDTVMQLTYLGAAHSDGDLSMYVVSDRVLLSGDIIFEGRVPFVGDADTKKWLEALQWMESKELMALVPGHGPAAKHPTAALAQTREYLAHLRANMGAAVAEMADFATAYAATDWSQYARLPAFDAANRRNAYQVYLAMERESMAD